jgi:hypothetical protein
LAWLRRGQVEFDRARNGHKSVFTAYPDLWFEMISSSDSGGCLVASQPRCLAALAPLRNENLSCARSPSARTSAWLTPGSSSKRASRSSESFSLPGHIFRSAPAAVVRADSDSLTPRRAAFLPASMSCSRLDPISRSTPKEISGFNFVGSPELVLKTRLILVNLLIN